MWIYGKDAFVSVVQDRNDAEVLIVRSRVKGDLEVLWPQAKIEETPYADYGFRTRLERREVAAAVAKEVMEISYSNYKDSITDKRRKPFYLVVWHAMWEMQDALGAPMKIKPEGRAK
jgi:hypothetical protein